MRFYERYAAICAEKGIEPCSQRAAEMFNVTRATISTWNSRHITPKGETVALVADALGVSADYLLGRTDDPTDYCNTELIADIAEPVLDMFGGDVSKALAYQKAVDRDTAKDKGGKPRILKLYESLDYEDRIRAEAYIEGMLTKNKYAPGRKGEATTG